MDKYALYVIVVYVTTFGVLAGYLGYLFRRLRQEKTAQKDPE